MKEALSDLAQKPTGKLDDFSFASRKFSPEMLPALQSPLRTIILKYFCIPFMACSCEFPHSLNK